MTHPTSKITRAIDVSEELHRMLVAASMVQGLRREHYLAEARRHHERIGEELAPEPDPQPHRGDGDQFGPEVPAA